MYRTLAALLLAASLLTACAPGGATPAATPSETPAPQNDVTVTVQDAEYTAAAHITELEPDAFAGSAGSLELAEIGRGADGVRSDALFRFPLPANIPGENVRSAFFYIRYSEGDVPNLRASEVNGSWNTITATWIDCAPLISPVSASGASEDAGGGWYQIDVTELVRGWLSWERNNNGFAIEETRDGARAAFYSVFAEDVSNCPKLVITYAPNEDTTRYGKFAYEPQQLGNCMSYALRDRDMILYDALFDTPVFQSAYDAGGIDAALTYVKGEVLDYINAHSDTLEIASVRELDAYDAEIDAATEYRIALRIGFRDRSFPEGIQVDEDFDYHFWAQLADGSWTEKTPQEPSRLVPGSNADTDPGAFPWHQGYMWGYEKWNDYYTSGVVYYAVTKTTDAFTAHMGGA
jgi:hypothetical protein